MAYWHGPFPRGCLYCQKRLQPDWVRHHRNLLIEGPTGTGKTFLACALGQSICEHGLSVRYYRASGLFETPTIAHGDGSFAKLLTQLAKTDCLIVDEWGLDVLSQQQRNDWLDIMEDRYGRGATLIASQSPISHWHEAIGAPTLADAILDRLLHTATKIQLEGESMRKKQAITQPAWTLYGNIRRLQDGTVKRFTLRNN